MNILFYMPTVLIGGVRTVTEILSDGLKQRGHNVRWLLHYQIYNDKRDYPEGRDVTYLPSKELLASENLRFYNSFIIENRIDVIVNQDGAGDGIELIDSIDNRGIKRISVIHNNPTFEYNWLFKDAIRLKNGSFIEKLKRIARVLLYYRTKQILKRSLKRHYDKLMEGGSYINVLSPSYIETIKRITPRLTDISAIANPNTYVEVSIPDKEKIVLFVGRIYNRSKRIEELLKIWKRISYDAPEWKLLIVGEGPDKSYMEKMAEGISSVEFLGYQNPQKYYEKASILCMTSLFEGFPMAVTEAMQHGCVPIAYDTFPAIKDMINNGKDGFIIKAFDRKAYADSMLWIINDLEKLRAMSKSAISNVKRFDRDHIIDQWESLISR